jgi:hypothetical protein
LGNTPFEREERYATIIDQPITAATWQNIRKGLASGRPWATEQTMAGLSPEEKARWIKRPRGRPPAKPAP